MPKLPTCSGHDAVKAFCKLGWQVDRQRGSHVILKKPDEMLSLSIPQHRALKPGLLRGLIRDAGITVDAFVDLL